MRRIMLVAAVLALAAVTGHAGGQQAGTAGQQPQVPSFRSAVTLVPIDVRVIDQKTGKPVAGLTAADFTVLEDGVPQVIGHFTAQRFTPEPPPSGAAVSIPGATVRRAGLPLRETALSVRPQTNRVFLIVLGRGRLQEPSKGLDAVIRFVRTQLLPQDYAAVFAYNRATDFTTGHERVAQIIERFRKENDWINTHVSTAMNGLAGIYGSKALPKSAQVRIDAVFGEAGTLVSRELGAGENRMSADRLNADTRRGTDRALDAVVDAGRVTAAEAASLDAVRLPGWSTFGAFVEENAQTLHDLGNLYAAIGYMRQLDGEKHLVFVTEDGLLLPRVEDDEELAAAASDARVVVDVLQTGGVGPDVASLTRKKVLRYLADATGGAASVAERTELGVTRLDEQTRSGYLLGYYPPNARWDGRFRKIEVRVNRPDVVLQFRHGYYARTNVPIFDRREFITRHRLESAAAYTGKLTDIRVRLKGSLQTEAGQHYATLEAQIDPGRLYFTLEKGLHTVDLDIAIVGMDQNYNILGGTARPVTLELNEDQFQAVSKTWILWQSRVAVPSGTRYVRIVVYDYMADLVGLAGVWVT